MDRIEKIKEMLLANADDSFLKHALGLDYIKLGKEEVARGLFEELLAHDPGYVGSYYHLAKIFERRGENEQAIAWYEKGMEAAKRAGDRHALNELTAACEELTS